MKYLEIPTNKDYPDNGKIQFKIVNVPGDEIIANSIELDGQLEIKINNTALATNNNLFWDGLVGVHQLIAFVSEKVNGRLLSNNQNYPRYVKMKRNATMESTNAGAQSDTVRELCSPTDDMTVPVLMGNANGIAPFSMKPYFSVNNSSRNMPYGEVQTIEIDINLGDKSIFYGTDSATLTFNLKNLRLRYRTQPAQKYNIPLVFPDIGYKTFDLTSDKSSNDIETPISTKWIMSSFANKANITAQPLQLLNPNPSRIKYLYNDQNNVGVAFEMNSHEEMLIQYLHAVGDLEDNNISPQNVNGQDSSFCVASSVGLLPPKTKISYQYDTDAGSSGDVYTVYTFFLGEIEL